MENWYVPRFHDMMNVTTCGEMKEEALAMAKDALNGIILTSLEDGFEIPGPQFYGEYPIEVDPQLAALVEERWKSERKVRKAFARSLKKQTKLKKFSN